MASKLSSYANEDRRRRGETVDIVFLILILLLLTVGLGMLYSASYAQSEYDTSYEITTRYLQKQAVCAAIGLAAMYFFTIRPQKKQQKAMNELSAALAAGDSIITASGFYGVVIDIKTM